MNFDLDTSKPDSALDAAKIFCSQYGAQIGVTEASLPLCIEEVRELLEQRVAADMAGVEGEGKVTEVKAEVKRGAKDSSAAVHGVSSSDNDISIRVK